MRCSRPYFRVVFSLPTKIAGFGLLGGGFPSLAAFAQMISGAVIRRGGHACNSHGRMIFPGPAASRLRRSVPLAAPAGQRSATVAVTRMENIQIAGLPRVA